MSPSVLSDKEVTAKLYKYILRLAPLDIIVKISSRDRLTVYPCETLFEIASY